MKHIEDIYNLTLYDWHNATVMEKLVDVKEMSRTRFSICKVNDKLFLRIEYQILTEKDDWYWGVSDWISSPCITRYVENNEVIWSDYDLKHGRYVDEGNSILHKFLGLKAFL